MSDPKKYSVGVTMPGEFYGYGELYNSKEEAYEAVFRHIRERLDEIFRDRKWACFEIDGYDICIEENDKPEGMIIDSKAEED